jgi:hypothetical protein
MLSSPGSQNWRDRKSAPSCRRIILDHGAAGGRQASAAYASCSAAPNSRSSCHRRRSSISRPLVNFNAQSHWERDLQCINSLLYTASALHCFKTGTYCACLDPDANFIKSALGFRQFLLRGLDKVRGEWSLVIVAWNMKWMFALNTDREA